MARILLVDDDVDIRRLVKKILESVGHQVVVVDNGLTAKDELDANIYDLLISDASMPQYSGFDLIRSIRRQKRHLRLPIAMLTGRREKQDIEAAIELSVDDYIVKPIDPIVLISKVEKLLEQKNNVIPLTTGTNRVLLDATLHSPLQIHKISENGFEGISPTAFAIDTVIHFRCEDLNAHGIDIHEIKITGCHTDPVTKSNYAIQGEFMNITESTLTHLQKYLQKNKKAI